MYAHVVRAVAIVSAFSATGAAVAAEPRLLSQADLDRITAGSLPEGFGRILTPALVRLGLISPRPWQDRGRQFQFRLLNQPCPPRPQAPCRHYLGECQLGFAGQIVQRPRYRSVAHARKRLRKGPGGRCPNSSKTRNCGSCSARWKVSFPLGGRTCLRARPQAEVRGVPHTASTKGAEQPVQQAVHRRN